MGRESRRTSRICCARASALAAGLVGTLLVAPSTAHAADDAPGAHAAGAFAGDDPRVETTLMADVEAVAPGDTVRIGVRFAMDPGWHVYWRNPGQTGLGTELVYTAAGADVGDALWPAPEVFETPDGFIVSYGYEGDVLLLADLTVAPDATGEVVVDAVADYLVCQTSCIPGRQAMRLVLPVASERREDPASAAAFDAAEALAPRPAADRGWSATTVLDPALPQPGERFTATLDVVAEDDATAPGVGARDGVHVFVPDRVSQLHWAVDHVELIEGGVRIVAVGELGADAVQPVANWTGVLRLTRGADEAPVAFSIPNPGFTATPLPETP